ncbi:hypothetical protein J672_2379 [Acinetobacter sp. 883425]|nr:hypothetical protein J672_2379 [Acinetobacter sp. 883425]
MPLKTYDLPKSGIINTNARPIPTYKKNKKLINFKYLN